MEVYKQLLQATSGNLTLLTSCEKSLLYFWGVVVAVARLFRGEGFPLDHAINPRV